MKFSPLLLSCFILAATGLFAQQPQPLPTPGFEDRHMCELNNVDLVTKKPKIFYTLNFESKIKSGERIYIRNGKFISKDEAFDAVGYCEIVTKSLLSALFSPSKTEITNLEKATGLKIKKLKKIYDANQNASVQYSWSKGYTLFPELAAFTGYCSKSPGLDYWVNIGTNNGVVELITCTPRITEGHKVLTLGEFKQIVGGLITVKVAQ